jgi:hypothetical protein
MKFQKIRNIVFTIPRSPEEKNWVKVTFENGTEWEPGLIDLGDILSKIGKCEDLKYPTGQGHKYTLKFISQVFNKTRREIIELYNNCFNPNKLKFSK